MERRSSLPTTTFFPEPQPLLTPTRRIMGLDGQAKMSKSMGNTIGLLESPEEIWAKLRPAVTDPKRIRKTDPGTPEVCNIYHLHKAFSPPATVEHVATQCSTAGWGCIDCKKVLAESMETELVPIRSRAAALRAEPARRGGGVGRGRRPMSRAGARDDARRARADGIRRMTVMLAREGLLTRISLALIAGISARCGAGAWRRGTVAASEPCSPFVS